MNRLICRPLGLASRKAIALRSTPLFFNVTYPRYISVPNSQGIGSKLVPSPTSQGSSCPPKFLSVAAVADATKNPLSTPTTFFDEVTGVQIFGSREYKARDFFRQTTTTAATYSPASSSGRSIRPAFVLDKQYVEGFRGLVAPFGYNGVGEFVYYRTYSRIKPNGKNEEWFETVERVVNGTYTMLKRWCLRRGIKWIEAKGQKGAKIMYRLIWEMKFLPPGRGLWAMGSPLTMERETYAALNNCAFVSTEAIATDPFRPFEFLMDASMLGVGVGFDTKGAGKMNIRGPNYTLLSETYVIPDSREGWVESVRRLLASIFENKAPIVFDYTQIRPHGSPIVGFGGVASGPDALKELHEDIILLLHLDIYKWLMARIDENTDSIKFKSDDWKKFRYTLNEITLQLQKLQHHTNALRGIQNSLNELQKKLKENSNPIEQTILKVKLESRTKELKEEQDSHQKTRTLIDQLQAGIDANFYMIQSLYDIDTWSGPPITTDNIVSIMNMIGKCVVAGNVRRTAEIAFGDPDSPEFDQFIHLKNYARNPHRADYGWTSNNSIFAKLGMDYTPFAKLIQTNGEPGFAWLENMRKFSRMNGEPDNKDHRVAGGNPCLEQSLESYELCCLVETFPARHATKEEFFTTLKYAYLYAKIVTLGPTPWEETNRVMIRNHRIGTSVTGIAQFLGTHPLEELRTWLDQGYNVINSDKDGHDVVYSEWLGVPRSKKTTSVKPSGTVSILAGSTPGIHYPESRFYIRRVRLGKKDALVATLQKHGITIEPALDAPNDTVIAEFPVDVGKGVRTLKDVSMREQLDLCAFMQRWWADNQVSATVTFDVKTEGPEIPRVLDYYQYHLKGISFLPRVTKGAYPQMPYETIDEETYHKRMKLLSLPIRFSVAGHQATPERGCNNDSCGL